MMMMMMMSDGWCAMAISISADADDHTAFVTIRFTINEHALVRSSSSLADSVHRNQWPQRRADDIHQY